MGPPCEDCSISIKTVDDVYHQVIERLTVEGNIKAISTQLLTIPEKGDKVLFVYKMLRKMAFLPNVRIHPKSEDVSEYYRRLGNEYYKHKKNYEAWQSYNLSLLYALTTSECFIYAVSNRSAVFFAMGKYNECLEDIKFVFNTNFPEKIRDKLLGRKNQCLDILAKLKLNTQKTEDIENKIKEIFTLKGPRDIKYVCASTKLKVVHTEEMGRHVIATEDIAVGEVLVEEDPYITVLVQSEFLFNCAYCLTRSMNLYPCMTCTFSMYCSIECRETALKEYHFVECRLLPILLQMDFSKMELLSLRTLLKSKFDADYWLKARDIVVKAEADMNTERRGCVKVGDNWLYSSKYYPAIHTLESNFEKRSISDLFRKCMSAAILSHMCVLIFSHFDGNLMVDSIKYVAELLLLHIMTSPTNMHSISTTIQNSDGKYVDEHQVASGAYAFHSLLNHSCSPNVVRYTKLGTSKMYLIAIRPIKKGMQVFDNYGYHYAVHDRNSRQSSLKEQYKFTCTCEACVNNWPMHADLKVATRIPVPILLKKNECLSPPVIEKLLVADKETALKYYQPLCELIGDLEPFAPCKELAECQESMKQCLAIFNGVTPYAKVLPWNIVPPCEALGDLPHNRQFLGGTGILFTEDTW